MKRLLFPIGLAVLTLLALTGTVLAQNAAVPAETSILDLLRPVLDAFRGGDYAAAGALALVVLVAVARRYGAKRIPSLATELGALALALVGSFAATLAAMISGPAPLTLAVLGTSAKIAFFAMGGFALAKKFVYPLLVKLRAKLPAWAQAILDVVLWVLDGGKAAAVAKAEKAGAAAVAATPSKGIAGVTGGPRDVP